MTDKAIVEAAFASWTDGSGFITDIFADDLVWTIVGHSLASRTYHSKQSFISDVLQPLAARFKTPLRPIAIKGVYADGDTVIVRWDGEGIATDGIPYRNSYAWFVRMRDGKVVEATAFFDSISFNDLWTRVKPA